MDRLKEIFEMQNSLMHRFHEIERANGFFAPPPPLNIEDPQHQLRFKELVGRFTEEMAEVSEAQRLYGYGSPQYEEEVSDALHFLVEACLHIQFWPYHDECPETRRGDLDCLEKAYCMAGFRSYSWQLGQITATHGMVVFCARDCLCSVWLACNELRNRPWKQTRRPVDIVKFHDKIRRGFFQFIGMCGLSGIGPEKLHQLYMAKHRINVQRQTEGV